MTSKPHPDKTSVTEGVLESSLSLPEKAVVVEDQKTNLSVLDRVLDETEGQLLTGQIDCWSDGEGKLTDGRAVKISASCLVQPAAKDFVLFWLNNADQGWILNVLSREEQNAPLVISNDQAINIAANKINIQAGTVSVKAKHLFTHTVNSHAIEENRTEHIKTKVSQVGTEIKRASRVLERIDGTLIQRVGTWIVNAAKEVRHKARTVLFD